MASRYKGFGKSQDCKIHFDSAVPGSQSALSINIRENKMSAATNTRKHAQLSSAASSVISAFSTLDTGQPFFALLAAVSNFSLSAPGTFALRSR